MQTQTQFNQPTYERIANLLRQQYDEYTDARCATLYQLRSDHPKEFGTAETTVWFEHNNF